MTAWCPWLDLQPVASVRHPPPWPPVYRARSTGQPGHGAASLARRGRLSSLHAVVAVRIIPRRARADLFDYGLGVIAPHAVTAVRVVTGRAGAVLRDGGLGPLAGHSVLTRAVIARWTGSHLGYRLGILRGSAAEGEQQQGRKAGPDRSLAGHSLTPTSVAPADRPASPGRPPMRGIPGAFIPRRRPPRLGDAGRGGGFADVRQDHRTSTDSVMKAMMRDAPRGSDGSAGRLGRGAPAA